MKAKLIAMAMLTAATLVPSVARPDDALERAEEACENYQWREALAWFEVAAESGDRRAQQIAGLMSLYGERLYPGVARDVGRAKAWLYRAEAQGSIEAKHMLARLERNPEVDPARLFASVPDAPEPR
jgi:TPR repeat protein